MYYLIYTSQSRYDWDETSLRQLLEQSSQTNKTLDITGMLVFLKERFIQLLEGPAGEVKQVFEKIVNDPRHEKVNVILEGSNKERLFEGWYMGFKVLDEEELSRLSGFKRLEDIFQSDQINDASHPALIFLKIFYERNIRDFVTG